MTTDSIDRERRFGGIDRLYGHSSITKLSQCSVTVIGIGGVGTWAAEALARSGVGHLRLIDMDVVSESNVNRQLIALSDTLGDNKIDVMAQRIYQINPQCQVERVDEFLGFDNAKDLLSTIYPRHQHLLLDCTDDLNAKLAIALYCRFNKTELVVAGGAGGKTNPSAIEVADLKDVYQDPLLAKMRSKLRQDYNINKYLKEKFRIRCVYSTQPSIKQAVCHAGGLQCGGYGSTMVVTNTMAMVMVDVALRHLLT